MQLVLFLLVALLAFAAFNGFQPWLYFATLFAPVGLVSGYLLLKWNANAAIAKANRDAERWRDAQRNEAPRQGETLDASVKRKFLAFSSSALDVAAERYAVLQAKGYPPDLLQRAYAPLLTDLIRTHFWSEMSDREREFVSPHLSPPSAELFAMFEPRIVLRSTYLKSSYRSPNMTPVGFEQWCAKILVANGWGAKLTQASGDQGADVIATKGGLRLVIQCKLYASPVGNKAVQEAFAAKSHYGATHAAVVTNASFTPSAKRLGSSTGVLLLHADDLLNVGKWIERSGTAPQSWEV